MKKWLKIGGIVSAVIVGVAALGIVAYSFLPTPVQAQIGARGGPWLREPGFGARGPAFGPGEFGGPPAGFIPDNFRGGPQFGPG